MTQVFPEIKKRFGFGAMRLPMKDGKIDTDQVDQMVDLFIENGFNYFDTAHGYHDGLSELTLKQCLTSRHSRDEYLLTNKLSEEYFKSEADIRPFFEQQLEACGVEYFDFYLMHAQDRRNYVKYQNCHAYETASQLKKEGKIRHMGISFHDTAETLDGILTDHPEVEIVQIQFNYLDYDDHAIQSGKCLEVCEKHGKPVIVMEPVKGGSLANLPEAARKVYDDLGSMSYASYAYKRQNDLTGLRKKIDDFISIFHDTALQYEAFFENLEDLKKWDTTNKYQDGKYPILFSQIEKSRMFGLMDMDF